MSSEPPASAPEPPRSSPFPGCLILATIVIVFGGLIVLYTVVGAFQNRALDGLTEERATPVPVLEPSPAEVVETMARVEAIGEAIEAGEAERILLTATDLNVLIATSEDLADFREQTWIERVSPQGIVARMVQPVRDGVLRRGVRYLHADFVLQPELRARTVAFKVMDIRPEKGDAPEGFVRNYQALDFFRLDPEWEVMREAVSSLGAVYTEGDRVVVETTVSAGE